MARLTFANDFDEKTRIVKDAPPRRSPRADRPDWIVSMDLPPVGWQENVDRLASGVAPMLARGDAFGDLGLPGAPLYGRFARHEAIHHR